MTVGDGRSSFVKSFVAWSMSTTFFRIQYVKERIFQKKIDAAYGGRGAGRSCRRGGVLLSALPAVSP